MNAQVPQAPARQQKAFLPLEQLCQWESRSPGRTWLVQPLKNGEVKTFTWGEGLAQVRKLAEHLQKTYAPGSRIALLSKNSAWWFIADFAIWAAGHVSVPIYPSLTGESVRQVLELSGASALIVGKLDDWESMAGGVPAELPMIRLPEAAPSRGEEYEALLGRYSGLSGELRRDGADLATIIYTSGTTGVPKGVMHSFLNMAKATRVLIEQVAATPEDRLISYLPTAHVADRLLSQLLSVGCGCRVFFCESLETFARDLQRARPTIFLSVPRLWLKFQMAVQARQPQEKLDRLLSLPLIGALVRRKIRKALGLDAVRVAMSGTAPLSAEVIHWYRRLGIEILEGYGMTENFAVSHGNAVGHSLPGSVGVPQAGVSVKLDEKGEVLVQSPCLMLGYYKDPERTREAVTEDGYLRTGDLGRIDAQNRLTLTGRAKEQFKTSKGKYVAPAPIENALNNHPKVEASLVAGLGFAQPFALLMLAAGEWERCRAAAQEREALSQSLEAMRLEINARLDPHERLDFLVVVPEQWNIANGFLTPTLKIKRAEVEKFYGAQFPVWSAQRRGVVWAQ